jgi:undecaprenyl-diphosphatase
VFPHVSRESAAYVGAAMMGLLVFPPFLNRLDDGLAQAINQLVGRWHIFDTIVAMPLQNDLLKAGVIGACFFAAWFGKGAQADPMRARRILLVTLAAAIMAIGTTRTLSAVIFMPRPFIRSQKIYHLEHDRLVEVRRFPYRVPLDHASQQHLHELEGGKVWSADLGSFPSDHAGLFFSVALGIWLASPGAGAVALAWTLFVILGAKLLGGQHTPLEALSGMAIATLWVTLCQALGNRLLKNPLERLVSWTTRHQAVTAAFLFVIMFEICNTLANITSLMHGAATFVKAVLK